MTLIPLSSTTITLPELKIVDMKVGNNKLLRYSVRAQQIPVTIYESVYKGWYELKTTLPSPYEKLYLRKPRMRGNVPSHGLCLQFTKNCDIAELDGTKNLKWIQHPSMGNPKKPDDIVSSWLGHFRFCEDNPELRRQGLRSPQLGAIHAIAAHFSVKRAFEPATVVLPTGIGKTETMLSVMFYRQLSKVLVVVPSNSLRNQITDKFYGLGYLPQLGVVPIDAELPAVVCIKSGVKSIAEADELLQHANVFVATASVLNCSNQEAIDHLCAGITDLFIDEAHYISAPTWERVRDRFTGKRVVQFTATPFRNDGSALGGRIIYNYTMGEAQKAGYFRHINLIPVEEYYPREEDRAIARSAVEQLRADLDQGCDHLMMARVEKKFRAEKILPIYQDIAPDLNPIVIHSGLSKKDINSALSALFKRDS